MAGLVKLNVGGTIFTTLRTTLIRAKYFESYFERWDNKDDIFIDESPKLFEHVLCYLRNSNYPIAPEYYYLLDYYGIDYEKPSKKEKKVKNNNIQEEMNINLKNITEEFKKSNKNIELLINSSIENTQEFKKSNKNMEVLINSSIENTQDITIFNPYNYYSKIYK